MHEGMNQNPNPVGQRRLEQNRGDAERLADYFARHPEPIIPAESLREAGPEIAEFEAMVASFESTHSLEKMNAIVDLSPNLAELFERADDLEDPKRIENAIKCYEKNNPGYVPVYEQKIANARAILLSSEDRQKFEMRRSAQKDLAPIVAMLDTLKKKTNISIEKFGELKVTYKHLTSAVGGLREGRVDHDR